MELETGTEVFEALRDLVGEEIELLRELRQKLNDLMAHLGMEAE